METYGQNREPQFVKLLFHAARSLTLFELTAACTRMLWSMHLCDLREASVYQEEVSNSLKLLRRETIVYYMPVLVILPQRRRYIVSHLDSYDGPKSLNCARAHTHTQPMCSNGSPVCQGVQHKKSPDAP